MKLVYIIFFALFCSFIYGDPTTLQINDLNTLKTTYGMTWDLTPSLVCTSASNANQIVCGSSNTAVIRINISPSLYRSDPFPFVTNLIYLTDLTVNNIPVDSAFWSNIPNFPQLNYLQAPNIPTIEPPANWGLNFPTSLTRIWIYMNSTFPETIFRSPVKTLTFSTGPYFEFPNLLQPSPITHMYLSGFSSNFMRESDAHFFQNLTSLSIYYNANAGQPAFSFDNFSVFPKLTGLYLTLTVPTKTKFPTSVFKCTELTNLQINGEFFDFSTISVIDLRNITKIAGFTIFSNQFDYLTYPGIILPPRPNPTIYRVLLTTTTANTVSNTLSRNVDFDIFDSLVFTGPNINSTIPNNLWKLPKNLVSSSFSLIQGAIPESFCLARDFAINNNNITSIPQCMICAINKFRSKIYPNNVLLPVYNSSTCLTTIIYNNTNNFPTDGTGVIEVNGKDLGWDGSLIDSSSTYYALTFDIPNYKFSATIPAGTGRNKNFTVNLFPLEVSPLSINLIIDYLPPQIQSIQLISNEIVITGLNFGEIGKASLIIEGLSYSLSDLYLTGSVYTAKIGINSIPASLRTEAIFRITLVVDSQSDNKLFSTLTSPPNIYQQKNTLSTSGGNVIFNVTGFNSDKTIFELTINNHLCIIENSSFSSLNVTYPPLEPGLQLVHVSFEDNLYDLYTYVTFVEPYQCKPTAHGICENNILVCEEGWEGSDCLSQSGNLNPPSKNETAPTSSSNTTVIIPGTDTPITVESLITVIELREYDGISGVLLYTHPLTNWSLNTTSNNIYLYTSNITSKNGNITTVTVTITYYKDKQTIIFANQTLNISPSSLKYQISLDQYPFERQYNRLMLVMGSNIARDTNEDICSSYTFGNDPTSENYDYMKLQIDKVSLYAKLIKFALIDNRLGLISNTLINDSISTQSNQIQTRIGINIPVYHESILLDPDFSVLIDSTPASSDQPNSKCSGTSNSKTSLTKAQIAGIVIGSIAFAVVAVIGIGYVVLKNRKSKLLMKRFHIKE